MRSNAIEGHPRPYRWRAPPAKYSVTVRAMGPAILLFAAASASAAPLSLPPDDVREIAEIQAQDAEHHDPENAYAIGVLLEKLGRWNEATFEYRQYLRETNDGGAHAFEANGAIDRMEHAAGFLKVRADVGFDRRVWLDGHAQPMPPPTTLIVTPGKHVVEGTGTAGRIGQEVEVAPKQLVDVWLGPGHTPIPYARPAGCMLCVLGRGGGEGGAPIAVASGIGALALARRRRRK